MKTARLFSIFGAMLLGLLLVRPATASILKSAKLSMSDPRPAVEADYTFAFTHDSANTIRTVSITFCQEPSWGLDCTYPTGMGLTNVAPADLTSVTGLDGSWALLNNGTATNVLTITRTDTGQGIVDDTFIQFTVADITNPAIAGCNYNETNLSTGTCYAHIGTYTGTDSAIGSLVDSAVVSFTVVHAVTVTARVDPTFTFVVEGVNTNATNNGVTTSVSSSFSALPFGNLTAGTPKYAAHKLTVTTNTVSGYTISIKMVVPMTGVYTSNNIDPYISNTHAAWVEPTGDVPNTDTGWIGYNTDDNDVTNWEDAVDVGQFGGVTSDAEKMVMKSTTSDDGSVSNYVSYAIEANVYQPADTYTGTLYYNALPTY